MDSQRDDFIWALPFSCQFGDSIHERARWLQGLPAASICKIATTAFHWADPRRQKLRRGLRWATSVTTEEVEQAIKEAREA